MSGTMRRWMFLALGAVMTAAAAGCVSPTNDSDSDADDTEETADAEQSLGSVTTKETDDGAPQKLGENVAASGSVLPGQDCSEPEPTPWHDRSADDGDDGDGDATHHTLTTTVVGAPTGGHHSR